jgi:hypothetical protein
MIPQSSSTDHPFEVPDEFNEIPLRDVMHLVPRGGGVLAGAAVALMVLGYLAIYLFVFLVRGPVG